MERTEWPTTAKREALRERGIVPFSPFASVLTVCIAFPLAFSVQKQEWKMFFHDVQHLIERPPAGAHALAADLIDRLFLLFGVPFMLMTFVVLLGGLFQTKFLFRFQAIAFQAQRLSPLQQEYFSRFCSAFWRAIFLLPFGLGAGALALYFVGGALLELLYLPREEFLVALIERSEFFLLFLFIILSLLAFLSWLSGRFLFMLKHRMTRKEVQQESAE